MEALELKNREFAQLLKQCTGSEELYVILNYINWLEKNCPQKGLDEEVMAILSNTLTKFNEVQYSNDPRYIGLLVKYMQVQPNALELFQLAFNQGKGVECAVLYCAWAGHLARMKELNAANQIYQLAIEKNAKPAEELQLAYLLFQLNLGRNTVGLPEIEGIEAFKMLLPMHLVQTSVPSQQSTSTTQPIQTKAEIPAWPVAIFEPENPAVVCCYPKKEIYKIPNHEYQYEEILAMRHENKLKRRAANVKEDNGAAGQMNVKELPKVVAYFEPENPKVMRCYPWKEVYANENCEFQLEEVYAAWYEKKLQEKMKNREKEKRKSRPALHPDELADLTRNSLMLQDAEQQEELCLQTNNNVGKQTSLQPKLAARHDNESASNDWSKNSQCNESTPHYMDSAPRSSASEPTPNTSHMNQSVTREVRNMVQDMWKSPSPVAAKNQAPTTAAAAASIRKSVVHTTATKTPFKFYVDTMEVDGGTPAANKENPANLESTARKSLHPAAKTPFKVYTDQMEVDGTPVSKENAPTNQKKAPATGDNNPQTVKQGFSSRFQRNQFLANDLNKNQHMEENPQSLASAVRPSSENASASNMNQSVTREVMNIIQDMWKDSTPSPVKGNQVHPQSVLIGRGISIFTDEKQDQKMAATSVTTAKRVTNQQPANAARFNHLQSRKSLHFSAAALAPDLKENQYPPPAQNFRVPAPRGGLKMAHDDVEMLPDSDFADTTCNTRAFQLALPSSTPLITHVLRGNNSANRDANNCSILLADGTHKPANPDLSVIMECSKEKYSSSSGSSSGVRTPYTLTKLHPAANEDIKEETEESQLERLVSQINLDENFDPFCPTFVGNLLASINFPQKHHAANMVQIDRDVPTLPHNATITLGNKEYRIESELGEGSYARVLRATNKANKKVVGLKLQKPAFPWEYYIAKEIQARLKNSPIIQGFMNIDCAFMFRNASILEMEFAPYGNLVSAVNKVKAASGKQIHVSIATLLSIQLFDIVDHLHKCKIIHGDIKPDNFVLFSIPTTDAVNIGVKLIDFGRSIDMTLLPEGIEFRRVVKTEDFQCTEMREGRPWTYQTDLFGLAGTAYLLLMGEYMKVIKKGDHWVLKKNLQRYLHREEWLPIYEELLNVESCSKLPNLSELRGRLQALLLSMDQNWVSHCLNSFGNILQGH